MIDSHCHLDPQYFAADRDEVLARARAAGVQAFVCVGVGRGLEAPRAAVALAAAEPDVFATVGVHPHEADAHPDLGASVLTDAASHQRVIAIGECGLDYFYDKSDRQAQRERFQAHIEAARTTRLPLVVHTRDAEDDTADMLEQAVNMGGVRGVLHCFTGSQDLARIRDRTGLLHIGDIGSRRFKPQAGRPES